MIHVALLGFCLISFACAQNIEDKKVVCYYASWSVYRTNKYVFKPSQIDPYLCTHLIYAFGAFDEEDKIKPFDDYQDITKGGYKEVTTLKSINKNLKVLLGLGGAREGSKNFSPLAESEERRKRFSKNIVDFLRRHDFDGLSLDWQHPALGAGSQTQDLQNYVLLIEALRYEFIKEAFTKNRSSLLISLTAPGREEYLARGYNLMKLQEFADIVNIAAYDYHYPFETEVYHHSPLYALPGETGNHKNTNLNVDGTVKYLLSKGVNLAKCTLGIPVYGRTFKLENPEENELGSPAKAKGTASTGIRAYYDVCAFANDTRWTLKRPNVTAMGPYAFRADDWVSFDDEDIVKRKAAYSVEKGMSGIMFWTLDFDDFRGDCGERVHPLLKSGREGLVEGLRRPPTTPAPTTSSTTQPTTSTTTTRPTTSTTTTRPTTSTTTTRPTTSTTTTRPTTSTTTTPTTTTKSTTSAPSTTTSPTLSEASARLISGAVAMDLQDRSSPRVLSPKETALLKENLSAISNKSASLAAEILSLSNYSTTVLLDNSSGQERMARLDSVVQKKENVPADEPIHTFQPRYGLELGGKLNQSHFYSIKIWIVNNLFNF